MKKVFSIIALMLMTVVGAMAQTYTVTVKEGTEDADKWTISPNTGLNEGDQVTIQYTGTKKVKSIKAVKKAPLTLTSPAVGQVIGSDGINYDAGASLPDGVTKVAMIAYVSGSEGLAIALADEANTMNWGSAVTTAAAHTPAFTGGTWKLPSQNEWKNMFEANGGSYSGLNTALANAGGDSSKLQVNSFYWSSTENDDDDDYAYRVRLYSGSTTWSSESKSTGNRVRACLAFTVEAPAARTLADVTDEDLGKIAGADGNIYDTKDAATTAGTSAVAMIAYVGTQSDCSHGLAIALADESETAMNWATAKSTCEGKTAVSGGTWRLPSIKDWQYMFIGCGASGSYSYTPESMSYSELASKLSTAGGVALRSDDFWSSTESSPGSRAWGLGFGGSCARWYTDGKDGDYLVRACLAF